MTKFKHNSSKLGKPPILLKFSELPLTSLRKYWTIVTSLGANEFSLLDTEEIDKSFKMNEKFLNLIRFQM